ncbi:hypothetical protein Pfo_022604 [Paulownia fortunei]|nr:hypothetical protein Pfo_022604 [Paulownia fortunei]
MNEKLKSGSGIKGVVEYMHEMNMGKLSANIDMGKTVTEHNVGFKDFVGLIETDQNFSFNEGGEKCSSKLVLAQLFITALIFSIKTKCCKGRIEFLKHKFNLYGFCVESIGKLVVLKSFYQFHIDAQVFLNNDLVCWCFIGFYGDPDVAKCKQSWQVLPRLAKLFDSLWLWENHQLWKKRKQRFRFEAMLGYEDESTNLMLWNKIHKCHINLIQWNRQSFGHIQQRMKAKEVLWKQCGKAQWLVEGDRNMRYFHIIASTRQKMNTVTKIRDEESIDVRIKRRFREVSPEKNQSFLRSFSAYEITIALKRMYPLKSSGPNNMPSLFFQRFWHIIGIYIIFLLYKMNYTHIVLIPKCMHPEFVSQYCPISLSNVIYKITSKMIVNCLKPLLTNVVFESRSAFIPRRLIIDNVLVTYEINQFMKCKSWGMEGHVALKLDMSKSYDKVEWEFLKIVLLRLGFHNSIVDLIMMCVSIVSYSLILNGEQFGYFRPQRGIHQGDSLSPYLFIFCAEVLSCLTRQAEARGIIKGIYMARQAPRISHLHFVDNTLIYCQAITDAIECVKDIFRTYALASGQEITLLKSTVVEEKHAKYLGLPPAVGSSKREVFSNIKDRIRSRVQEWMEKSLSDANKEVLLKFIIQAIPTIKINQRYTRWLGLNCVQLNRLGAWVFSAMLAKQAWGILTKPNSLVSQIFRAKYFPNSDFLEANLGSLIEWDRGSWNVNLIEQIFWPEDAKAITSIPLCNNFTPDTLVWHYTRNDIFSVKSAYFVAKNMFDNLKIISSGSVNKTERRWDFLWSNLVPNQGQIICIEELCPVCQHPGEDLYHIFLDCPFALIWRHHNRVLIDHITSKSHVTLEFALGYKASFMESMAMGTIKVNFDRAIFKERNKMGTGIIARDHTGCVVAWLNRVFHYVASPVVIEALAVSMGWMSILIEGDCFKVIHKFQVEFEGFSPIGHIIHNVKSKIKMLVDCHLLHVRRTSNSATH